MTVVTYFLSISKATTSTLKVAILAFKGVSYLGILRGAKVNPLSMSDEVFIFLINKLPEASGRKFYPLTAEETQNCRSLCNLGVLRLVGDGYKLTWANRCLARKT